MTRIPPLCSLIRLPLISISLSLLFLVAVSPRLARAQDNQLALVLEAVTAETDFTTSQAWGDFDNDGDLDLIVGNGIRGFPDRQHNRLYCNEGGVLRSCWISPESEFTFSVAWGDMDGDHDLDLAVGNGAIGTFLDTPGAVNRIYRNEGKDAHDNPRFTAVWHSPETDPTIGVAWGDYDNDGDLDLAVANGSRSIALINIGQPNRIYRNMLKETGQLNWVLETTFSRAFSSPREVSFSVAWVDVDKDGFLDLAVTNVGTNRLYCNRLQGAARVLIECWNSAADGSPQFTSTSMSWGDYDGDTWLDLAVGNGEMFRGQPNQLYHNDGLTPDGKVKLTLVQTFTADAGDTTTSIAWGDADRDGDLDLAVGNGNFRANQQSRIYCNVNQQINPSACWSSPQTNLTLSIAWGDVDSDGDLDLALGNISLPVGQNNFLYRNDSVPLATVFDAKQALPMDSTRSLAWGDVEGDGDLDLMAGNINGNRLFRNDEGLLTAIAVPAFTQSENTSSVAWGDMDGDRDLDLIVGNAQSTPSHLYCNKSDRVTKTIALEHVPTFAIAGDTSSVVWGDYDNDGDLDLAFGNGSLDFLNVPMPQPNRIYRNDGSPSECRPIFTEVWVATEQAATRSVAWGDVDRDGDLDLAVGNAASANQLYRNDGRQPDGRPIFTLTWTAVYTDDTHSIAWGDMNGDGWLDLAVGNTNQSNRVYCNQGGVLAATDCWRSLEADRTRSIAWGDMDGDGDLDLAAGNQEGPERLYLNKSNSLLENAVWSSDDRALFANRENRSWTLSVAWGDIDGDGDLDLAAGNSEGEPSGIYRNLGHSNQTTLDQAPFVTLGRPGQTPAATFFASAEILQTHTAIPITYTLYAPNPALSIRIFPEYSVSGGGQWFKATPAASTPISTLHAITWPTGSTFVFHWDAAHDLIKEDNVVFRIRSQAHQRHSPISSVATGSQSPLFRVVAPWYVHVVNERGQPIANASLFAASDFITKTNRAGLVGPQTGVAGKPMVALAPIYEQRTQRQGRPLDLAYTIYQTSLTERELGVNRPFTATDSGEQLLTTTITMPLVLFDLIVSIEWPADITYTQSISEAIHHASDYLFDLTDGQMAFGEVAIYDDAQYWSVADIQIAAQNTVQPHAYVGGITSPVSSEVIRIGRAWDGRSGNQGWWNAPDGYRTIAHEFGHYGLGLYDEYFRYRVDADGNFGERVEDITCIGIENREIVSDTFNASAMDYQYTSSELSDEGLAPLWGNLCEFSAQYQLNGQSTWDTIVQHFGGQTSAKGKFLRPSDRQAILTGPADLPQGLPDWPAIITATHSLTVGHSFTLSLFDQGEPFAHAGVALHKDGGGRVIEQGRTITDGTLTILGAVPNDVLRISSSDGALAGSLVISTTALLTTQVVAVNHLPGVALFNAIAALAPRKTPYLRIVPMQVRDGDSAIEMNFTAYNFDQRPDDQAGLTVIVSEAGKESARFTQAAYSVTEQGHSGRLNFTAGKEETNNVQVIGSANNEVVFLQASYRLQRVANHERTTIYASDGNLSLELNPATLLSDGTYLVINSQNTTPGPPPAGYRFLSKIYDITASGSVVQLELPAALTIAYDAALVMSEPATNVAPELALYRWDANTQTWQLHPATLYPERHVIATQVDLLGIYAVMEKE